jgi:hypothetical protein
MPYMPCLTVTSVQAIKPGEKVFPVEVIAGAGLGVALAVALAERKKEGK